jgi:3',5'-nucleoside bisphosphate phosphatase
LYSDGTFAPEDVVDLAARRGIAVLALTDHDTTGGLASAAARGATVGVEVLPGIELSVNEEGGRLQLHLLGYGIAPDAPALRECTEHLTRERRSRASACIDALRHAGVTLDPDRVSELAGSGTIGRPHIAQALVEIGACRDVDDAFVRFLRSGRPGFIPAPGLTAARAIEVVHRAGGVVSFAHPPLSAGLSHMGGLDRLVGRLVVQGLDGLEVRHPSHKPSQRRRLGRLCREHGLLATGGSDFHGASKPHIALGCMEIERTVCDAVRARIDARRDRELRPGEPLRVA